MHAPQTCAKIVNKSYNNSIAHHVRTSAFNNRLRAVVKHTVNFCTCARFCLGSYLNKHLCHLFIEATVHLMKKTKKQYALRFKQNKMVVRSKLDDSFIC
jgi:hypothetical protein